MGYVSLREDDIDRFYDLSEIIETSEARLKSIEEQMDSSTLFSKRYSSKEVDEMLSGMETMKQQLRESKSRLVEYQKQNETSKAEKERLISENYQLRVQNTKLLIQINEKQNLLNDLKRKIKEIIETHEFEKKSIENRNEHLINNTLNKVEEDKAEFQMNTRKEIGKISSIINRSNFHKDPDNIKTLKLIVKNLMGL